MRLSARASRRTRKCRATKVRNLEQEMRQNNVVFVFARGEKFRQIVDDGSHFESRKTT